MKKILLTSALAFSVLIFPSSQMEIAFNVGTETWSPFLALDKGSEPDLSQALTAFNVGSEPTLSPILAAHDIGPEPDFSPVLALEKGTEPTWSPQRTEV